MPGGRRNLVEPKSQAPQAAKIGPEHLTEEQPEEQRVAMYNTGLTVVRQGVKVVGVPVGTEHFKRNFVQETVNGNPAELVKALVPMEDAQASFQIWRIFANSRLSYLLRTVVKKSKRGACEQKAATVLPNRTAAA